MEKTEEKMEKVEDVRTNTDSGINVESEYLHSKNDGNNKKKGFSKLQTLLLLFITIVAILSFFGFQGRDLVRMTTENNRTVETFPENAVLVAIETRGGTKSDHTQIENALKSGGQFYYDISDSSWLHSDMYVEIKSGYKVDYQEYGAKNSKEEFYLHGAILNFIASRGWTLVSIDGSNYYFTKSF